MKVLGGFGDSTVDLPLLASQDGQETASRGTESDTRTSSTPHVSPLMSTRNVGKDGARAPLLARMEELQLCLLMVTGRARF